MFKYDSPIMTFLGRIADLVILNLLTLICCIPVITAGAAITAAHYTALKMQRDSGNYVVRNFFKSFKQNFLQGTLLWILWLVIAGLSIFAYMFYPSSGVGYVLKLIMMSVLIVLALMAMWLFPVQARFVNTIRGTIQNAFFLTCKYLIRTLGMVVITGAGAALWLLLSVQWYWIPLLFGIAVPVYLCVFLYNKVFEGLEEQIEESQAEQDTESKTEEDSVEKIDAEETGKADVEEI